MMKAISYRLARPEHREGASRQKWIEWAIWGVIAWSLLLMVANSFINPLFEAPDEVEHFGFVLHLLAEGDLPVQEVDGQPSQSHQTPLYYLIASVLISPVELSEPVPTGNAFWTSYYRDRVHQDNKNQFLPAAENSFPYAGSSLAMHILRLYSVVLATATLVVGRAIGRHLWRDRPVRTLLLLGFVALNPMFIYIGSSLNNDNLVNLFAALVILLTLRAIDSQFSWTDTLLLTLCWSGALLSKLTGLFLPVTWGSALLIIGWRAGSFRLIWSRSLAILLVFASLTGWWFSRNVSIYGEPFALNRTIEVWGARPPSSQTVTAFYAEAIYIWTNFWGRFGYGQVTMPDWSYWLFALLALPGLVGLLWIVIRQRPNIQSVTNRQIKWLVLSITFAIYLAALGYYTYQNATGANGRYVYPAIFAGASLLVLGWSQIDQRQRSFPIITIIIGIMATYAILYLGSWTFARPDIITVEQAQARVNQTKTAQWSNGINLLGTAFVPIYHDDERGLELESTFCWQADRHIEDDLVFFVHLLDSDLNPLGQRDSYSGQGNYPSSLWQPGDVFCDRLNVPVIESMIPNVVIADIEIGFYNLKTGERQRASFQGNELEIVYIDRVRLAPAVLPDQPAPPTELLAEFEQGVTLLGYEWSDDEVPSITLWWQSSGPLDANYQIFAQLVDGDGFLFAQGDGAPQAGRYPTGLWGAGEVIVDQHNFVLGTEIPRDAYEDATLFVGFYLLETGSRLPRVVNSELPDAVAIPGPQR